MGRVIAFLFEEIFELHVGHLILLMKKSHNNCLQHKENYFLVKLVAMYLSRKISNILKERGVRKNKFQQISKIDRFAKMKCTKLSQKSLSISLNICFIINIFSNAVIPPFPILKRLLQLKSKIV